VETLGKANPLTQCDYRFFPRSEREPIWIRERAALATKETNPQIVSAYTEISDLRSTNGAEKEKADNDEAAKELIHDFQNVVQKVSMEVEFALMDLKKRFDSDYVLHTIDSIDNSLQGLRDQVANILRFPTSQDPAAIVDGIVRKMRRDLNRQNVNLRLVRRESVPMVKGDEEQLCSAFEHVFEFCGAMLKNGGDLEVEARRKEIHGQVYAEVKVTSSSAACIEVGEKPENIPSAGHRIGLGLTLAQEILARYRGQVFFERESKTRGQVTVLIKASPR
jgi:light-regulated signal transduction histidine kinase (bacteriophytochrome)